MQRELQINTADNEHANNAIKRLEVDSQQHTADLQELQRRCDAEQQRAADVVAALEADQQRCVALDAEIVAFHERQTIVLAEKIESDYHLKFLPIGLQRLEQQIDAKRELFATSHSDASAAELQTVIDALRTRCSLQAIRRRRNNNVEENMYQTEIDEERTIAGLQMDIERMRSVLKNATGDNKHRYDDDGDAGDNAEESSDPIESVPQSSFDDPAVTVA